jgi:hypothetical protein
MADQLAGPNGDAPDEDEVVDVDAEPVSNPPRERGERRKRKRRT